MKSQVSVDRLDEVLAELLVATYHYDGKNLHLISPKKLAKIKSDLLALFKSQQKELIDRVDKEVIGENEFMRTDGEYDAEKMGANKLRAKQRQTLDKIKERL